ncbi:DNA modification methylase [Beggiatoa sp. PS]|nr:DNA modification methylase [Beggiatoa sp. PS]
MERMILASSNEGDTILDPFFGSGTTLRVCQQLNRKCIGFEMNPEYIELTKNRLIQPFKGFDSVDPRMERVPLNLPKTEIREPYLHNHVHWFLKNHEDSIKNFNQSVKQIYGEKWL